MNLALGNSLWLNTLNTEFEDVSVAQIEEFAHHLVVVTRDVAELNIFKIYGYSLWVVAVILLAHQLQLNASTKLIEGQIAIPNVKPAILKRSMNLLTLLFFIAVMF